MDRLPTIPQLAKERRKIQCPLFGALALCPYSRLSGRVRESVGLWLWVAELPASGLCRRKGGLRSIGDEARLVLGHRGQNVNREPVRKRHIGRNEINIALQKPGDHRDAARQSVETGNDQLRVIDTAKPKRLFELRSIFGPAAFDFRQLGKNTSRVCLGVAAR